MGSRQHFMCCLKRSGASAPSRSLGLGVCTCMRAGRLKVTDAMFPDGSPALVEPIYGSPLLSAPFNEQLAAALRAFVLARLEVWG